MGGPRRFAGFDHLAYTQIPDHLLDELMPRLRESELKVLLYICRRTFGWKRASDEISLSQIQHGITRADGTQLDGGTGLSRPAVVAALRSLIAAGIVVAIPHTNQRGDHATTTYSVSVAAPTRKKVSSAPPAPPTETAENAQPAGENAMPATGTDGGAMKNRFRGVGNNVNHPPVSPDSAGNSDLTTQGGSKELLPGVVNNFNPQETVNQQTVKRESHDSRAVAAPDVADAAGEPDPPATAWQVWEGMCQVWGVDATEQAARDPDHRKRQLALAARLLGRGYTAAQILACWEDQRSSWRADADLRQVSTQIASWLLAQQSPTAAPRGRGRRPGTTAPSTDGRAAKWAAIAATSQSPQQEPPPAPPVPWHTSQVGDRVQAEGLAQIARTQQIELSRPRDGQRYSPRPGWTFVYDRARRSWTRAAEEPS